jgi:protocatechuate 3,4-dioxygenase beta subunit
MSIALPLARACVLLALAFGSAANASRPHEPLVGHPCDGCEGAFDGLPADIPAELELAHLDPAGEPLTLEGRVLDRAGRAMPGIVLYVHQTDASGIYPEPATDVGRAGARHGRLRGWVRSDAEGRWRIRTVRPGGYPGTDIPQHVHMQVIEPGCATYYLDDILFKDDPRLTAAQRATLERGTGGPGTLIPRGARDSGWHARRDVVLGQGVPGYPACGKG